MGGTGGPLEAALGAETCGLRDGGCFQEFEYGEIDWSPTTGAHAVTDPYVHAEWVRLGAEDGPGYPTTDTFCGLLNGGCGQHFQYSSIYDSHHGTFAVDVAMLPAWRATNWEWGLGYPIDVQHCGLRGGGCVQAFENGRIYLTPKGAFAVESGVIDDEWAARGWENGGLGYPTSSTFRTLGTGWGQHFENGSIYWADHRGMSVLSPAMRDRWGAIGWERGALGGPIGSTFCGLRDGGCGQKFQGGSIYSSPRGAFVVRAGIDRGWSSAGWENGWLGYPVSNTFCMDAGCGQHFEGGSVYIGPDGYARKVVVPIRERWAAEGWEHGPLGMPVGDSFCGLRDGGCGQHFRGGSIYWSPATGARVVHGFQQSLNHPILVAWSRSGWETGALGYPTSEHFCGLPYGGCGQHFQGGSVYYSHAAWGQGFIVSGPIRDHWARQGWERGRLGYPTAAAYGIPGGTAQRFQGGTVRVVNGRVSVS